MKHIKRLAVFSVAALLLSSALAFAETEQERYQRLMNERVFGVGGQAAAPEASEESEMERLQRQMNERVFGVGGSAPQPKPAVESKPVVVPEPKPVVVPVPVPTPKPKLEVARPVPTPTVKPVEGPVISEVVFSEYRLEGVGLGMAKSDVLAFLAENGFACNMQQMAMMQMSMGMTICMKGTMMTAPKILSLTFARDQLNGLDMMEQYESAFPKKIYQRVRDRFMTQYGDEVACKKTYDGEICELFGENYRIVLKAELSEDEVEITQGIHPL